MGRLRTAFLAISLVFLVCVSEEIISRRGANRGEAHGDDDVAEQTWIHCRKELKDTNKDCLLYIPPRVPAANDAVLTGYRHWFSNWVEPLLDSTTSYPTRKLIGKQKRKRKRKKFRVSAPNFALGPAPGFAPGPSPGFAPAHAPTPQSYELVAPSGSPSQPSSYPPAEAPDESNSGPTKKRTKSIIAPSQSVPGPPPPPPEKKNDILMDLIIAVASTAVLTFFLVALLFLCCFRRNRKNSIGPRNGPRDEGPLLHLSDLSAGSNENSPKVAATSRRFFTATSKKRSFLSRVSLKRNNHEFSPAAVSSSSGLPPPPGRSAAPPLPPPAPLPPKAPPPPPPKSKPPPPAPPKLVRPPPAPPKRQGRSSSGDGSDVDSETGAPKTKLKPFFWDKMTNPDQKMVWHEISAGSFQFNEEAMESFR